MTKIQTKKPPTWGAIDGAIGTANGRLRAGKIGVAIERVGGRLVLRATLPPKGSSDRKEPYQQRIHIGVHANGEGLKAAEAEAKKIGALLDQGRFDWSPYIREREAQADRLLVAGGIEAAHQFFLSQAKPTESRIGTWRLYEQILLKLPPGEHLNGDLVRDWILEHSAPDTANRIKYCRAASVLIQANGLDLDLKKLRGNYSPATVSERDLPSDQEIAEWRERITDPAWQWAYGAMACYGLRNHEIFRVDPASLTQSPGILRITEGKTGERKIWPCYPEWWERWELGNVQIPVIKMGDNRRLGMAVSKWFRRRAELPFKPYDLRHAWAVRTLEFGLDLTLAAAQMGHSVEVHTRIYHRWISDRHHQRAFEALMQRSDRPFAP